MRVLELFAGIGACSTALTRLGIEHEIVDAVEIDKFAMASFNAIHGTNFEPQDITTWDKDLTDIDLIMHGSPCQDFSVAGKQAGGDENSGTRSSLMYETVRIVGKIKPKYVIWENVKNVLSKKHRHNFDKYLEYMQEMGYNNYYQVLNAKDYGIPQNRERVFTISIRQDIDKNTFKFPEKQVLTLRLKDILEDSVDEKYYLNDEQVQRIKNTSYVSGDYEHRVRQQDEICNTLRARDWKDPKCVQTTYNNKGKVQDREKECCVLQATIGCGGGNIPLVINPLKDKTEYSWQFEQQVYDKDGITRAVKAGDGSGNIPKVIEEPKVDTIGNYSPSNYDASRIVSENGIAPTVKENHGTVTAVAQRGREGGQQMEISNREYANSLTTVQKDSMIAEKIGNIYPSGGQNGNVYTTNGLSPTISSGIGIKGNGIGSNNAPKIQEKLRIRKLTPKECWRLMGFNDEEFEKASKVSSNSQLYKQAGNSIVVNVLEEIFKNLFGG